MTCFRISCSYSLPCIKVLNCFSIQVGGKTGVGYADLVHGKHGEAYVTAAAHVLSHKTIDITVSLSSIDINLVYLL